MSDDTEVELETLEVGIPDEQFLSELLGATDAETLDDLITRTLDQATRGYGEALEHEPVATKEIEVPADARMRFEEVWKKQDDIDDLEDFLTYLLASQYVLQRNYGGRV